MTQAEMLSQSADDVLQAAERHRMLLRSVHDTRDLDVERCLFADCPHRRKLRRTLAETVQVLEQTRKAFRSKQLEVLRKRLIGVLAEDA